MKKAAKRIIALIFLLCLTFSLYSCRYINPTELLFVGELPDYAGTCDDFGIRSYKRNNDVYEYHILNVTSKALSKNYITIPETCELDGETIAIKNMESGVISDWVTLETLRVENSNINFEDEVSKSISLKALYISENVPISNFCDGKGIFLKDATVPNIYFDNQSQWDQAKKLSGVDKFNVYVKNSDAEYIQVQNGYLAEDSDLSISKISIIINEYWDIAYIGICAFLILTSLLSIAHAKHCYKKVMIKYGRKYDDPAEKVNNPNWKKVVSSKKLYTMAIIVFALQIAFTSCLKLLKTDISMLTFGLNLLLPLGVLFSRSEFRKIISNQQIPFFNSPYSVPSHFNPHNQVFLLYS